MREMKHIYQAKNKSIKKYNNHYPSRCSLPFSA